MPIFTVQAFFFELSKSTNNRKPNPQNIDTKDIKSNSLPIQTIFFLQFSTKNHTITL